MNANITKDIMSTNFIQSPNSLKNKLLLEEGLNTSLLGNNIKNRTDESKLFNPDNKSNHSSNDEGLPIKEIPKTIDLVNAKTGTSRICNQSLVGITVILVVFNMAYQTYAMWQENPEYKLGETANKSIATAGNISMVWLLLGILKAAFN